MADATKLPSLKYFQFSTPDQPKPTLTKTLLADITDDEVKLSAPPLDEDGNIITGDFILGVTNENGYTEIIYCPAGSVSADGLTISNVIRGVRLSGIDYTTSDATLAQVHQYGSSVFCSVNAIVRELVIQALKGNIATAGNKFVIGNDVNENITLAAKVASGELGFVRYNPTTGKAEYSNNGTTWNSIDDVTSCSKTIPKIWLVLSSIIVSPTEILPDKAE